MGNFQNRQTHRQKIGQGVPGAGGEAADGHRVSLWGVRNTQKLDGGDDCTTLSMY